MSNENNQHSENIKKPMKTILLVEDDSIISELLIQMIIQETPYNVFSVPDGLEALDLVKNIKPQLLILDYWLPFIRSEEHTSELQSRRDLVCRLLLEKKK